MEDERENKYDADHYRLPRLNMRNWRTEFKEAFKEYALKKGEAGEEINTGERIDLLIASFNDVNEEEERIYPDTDRGYRQWERDDKRLKEYRKNAKDLLSTLLIHMEREVKDKVQSSEEYEEAYATFDVLTIWQLTEQVCVGRSAVSVYAMTAKLLKLKQTKEYSSYAKEFREAIADLIRQGDPQEVLNRIFNTIFILGLNQEQFKDKLAIVYGQQNWPAYDVYMAELHVYAEATERMKSLTKDNNDGKVEANKTQLDPKSLTRGCWNCGSLGHVRYDCRKPSSLCPKCNKRGHLERFCKVTDNDSIEKNEFRIKEKHDSDKSNSKKPSNRSTPPNRSRPKKKVNHKAEKNRLAIQKAKAHLAQLEADDNDEKEEYDNASEAIDYDEDDEEYDENEAYLVDVIEIDKVTALISDEDGNSIRDKRFIIDSGCKGAHITNDERLLKNSIVEQNATIRGISGHSLVTSHKGYLPVEGKSLCVPNADANLLSLKLLLKSGGRFEGDFKSMNVYHKNGELMLHAYDTGDGYWSCSYNDLNNPHIVVYESSTNFESVRHYSAEERVRAKEAFELCAKLGHPNDKYISNSLDFGSFDQCHLTSQDLRNARELYGVCPACLEAKIHDKATPNKSITTPAYAVGEHIHCDLIPLTIPSIGGNNFILFAVDEKSGYCIGIPLKSKSKKSLIQGFSILTQTFNAYKHRITLITTDDEKNFLSVRSDLASWLIKLTSTPANFHEKRAERYIQTLKSRVRAVKASLTYVLPSQLDCEAYLYCIKSMNLTPNKVSYPLTPHQIVTNSRAFLPRYYFGQTGVFHFKRKDSPDIRSEWGLFLGYGDSSNYLRAYIPTRKLVYSRRTFKPNEKFPLEWNFKPRIASENQKSPVIPVTIPMEAPTTTIPSALNQEGESIKLIPSQTTLSHRINQQKESQAPYTKPPEPIITEKNIDDNINSEDESHKQPETPLNDSSVVDLPPNNIIPMLNTKKSYADIVKDNSSSSPQIQQQPVDTTVRPKREAAKRNHLDGPVKFRGMFSDAGVVYRMSLQKALKQKDRLGATLNAIDLEIENMENGNVMPPIHFKDIPTEKRSQIIDLFMFLKDKFKANGDFDKTKARLVAQGNTQDIETVGDTNSPTVNPITVMTMLNYIATNPSYIVSAHDIKHAFLLPSVQSGKDIYIRIRKDVVDRWLVKYPYRKQYVNKSGNMFCKLDHYLYGLQEASKEFHDYLTSCLREIGFTQSKADPCLYTCRHTKFGLIHAATHVDDILLLSPNSKAQTWFTTSMAKYFELVSQYQDISYLGMSIRHDKRSNIVYVNQEGFIKDIIKKFHCDNIKRFPITPATESLCTHSATSERFDTTKYLSLTMSLMYLARFTRSDILMPITYLATRSANPTVEDFSKLMRVVRYLAGTPTIGLQFTASDMQPRIYADASHSLHADGRGQGGVVITLGSAPIFCRSFKIKSVTRSSSETELVALEDASTYVNWLHCLLKSLSINIKRPTPIFQDNKSTILIVHNGGNFKRTKHLICKESFVRERITRGEVELKYLPTTNMPADILTKPVSKKILLDQMEFLHVK